MASTKGSLYRRHASCPLGSFHPGVSLPIFGCTTVGGAILACTPVISICIPLLSDSPLPWCSCEIPSMQGQTGHGNEYEAVQVRWGGDRVGWGMRRVEADAMALECESAKYTCLHSKMSETTMREDFMAYFYPPVRFTSHLPNPRSVETYHLRIIVACPTERPRVTWTPSIPPTTRAPLRRAVSMTC